MTSGIGSFAIQYAKSIGATVVTTAGSEDKLNYCRSIGADHAISYRGDWPAAVGEVAPDGIHMILDNMGAKYLGDHVQLLATDGALVIIGMQGGRKGTLDLPSLTRRRGLITASSLRARSAEEKSAICRGLVQNVWAHRRQHDQAATTDRLPSGRGGRRTRAPRVRRQHRQDHPLCGAVAASPPIKFPNVGFRSTACSWLSKPAHWSEI